MAGGTREYVDSQANNHAEIFTIGAKEGRRRSEQWTVEQVNILTPLSAICA